MEAKHEAYRCHLEKSDTVVVFIHGIQGSPLQFDFLTEGLRGLYSFEALLLPGHGQTAEAFRRSGMAEWQAHTDEKIRRLQDEYENIILVGHSMGGLLSVQTALSCPLKIRGLFLIALPLKIHVSYQYIKDGFAVAFPQKCGNDAVAAARSGGSVAAFSPFDYLASLPRYIELLGKIRATRELIGTLRLPIAAVHSANDEIVSEKSLLHIRGRPNTKTVVAEDAGHYYFPPKARKQISNALTAFIREVTAGGGGLPRGFRQDTL